MKAYFACSIRGGGDTSFYLAILEGIKRTGTTVLSEVFVHDALTLGGSPLPADEIYERDTNMIQDADIVIAEVSNPSLGVGYELAYAEQLGKPVLCLYHAKSEKSLSAMVRGNNYFTVEHFDSKTVAETIQRFIALQSAT